MSEKYINVYYVELYGDDDILKEEWAFETKSKQLEHYYSLINKGYRRDNILKVTRKTFVY